ncbi:MAG: sterol desaturase family protein [Candidatus Marinimicrobia bacterium]|jgi:sterol desaturase/sphingolipid hydroxylase (fatty acid hydroxylase superfamily)|nr:sterol desaturase family protein [Candidatus Neomarinimicrobiota bacterium]MBT3501356.1 sterol desaturase family protein [Candidatus Neomarinimicrobiota bacterium]MBT3839072.1 sterol desaturase family protein [Candidatus Neomarinimicrobiota bacterium]MBT4283584.1 sterol desaturase family protein [Candidatus Neomarinimicrobiota bacterium]MBT4580396.1 sterol desaturase family protein [Candidatus Neomarinimicrobiota bacterium]
MNDIMIRAGIFLILLIILISWELLNPKRKLQNNKFHRWVTNLSLIGLNNVVVIIIIPFSTIGVAHMTEQNSLGLFNSFSMNDSLIFFLSILILDFIIYIQHVIFHRVPAFWRFHKIHHIDKDIDVTTGLRFHPVEIVLSLGIKFIFIILLGVPVLPILFFEIILNGMAMFNHANIQIPKKVDNILRYFLVTPDMHRVHHSVNTFELNSNFGFNLSIWDRILGTYIKKPLNGHTDMTIGLEKYQNKHGINILILLIIPFLKKK